MTQTLGALASGSAAAAAQRAGSGGGSGGGGEQELGSLSQWVDGEDSAAGTAAAAAAAAQRGVQQPMQQLTQRTSVAAAASCSPEDPSARPSPPHTTTPALPLPSASAAPRTLGEAGHAGASAASQASRARYMASMQSMSDALLGNMHTLTSGLAAGIEALERKMARSEAHVEAVRAQLGASQRESLGSSSCVGMQGEGAGLQGATREAALPPSRSPAFYSAMAAGRVAMDLQAMKQEVQASQARLGALREEAEAQRVGLGRNSTGLGHMGGEQQRRTISTLCCPLAR